MQRSTLFVTAVCILLISTTAAFASPDGGEHGLPWMNFFYRILTFVGFIAILAYFMGKKAKDFLKARTSNIATEISSLEERKIEAQKKLADVEHRIRTLDEERSAIIAEYTAQGEAIKASIIDQAGKAATLITSQAKITAENEITQAMQTMRSEMADKIVEATEQLLAKKLSASEQTKLIDKYLTKVVLN